MPYQFVETRAPTEPGRACVSRSAELRSRISQFKILSVRRANRGCYAFLRTRSQNPRGSTILMGASAAISRRSRSPVTSTSTPPSIADARIHWSSGSRFGTAARIAGFGTTSCSRRNLSISLTARGGRPIRFLSTRPSSRSTTSPVTRVCSVSTTRSTSAQTPRVAKALTKTFVSRKTLKRRRARHLRPSGSPAPQRTAGLYVGAVRISAGSTAAEEHRAQAHFGSGRSVCRVRQGVFPVWGQGEWSRKTACHTMYYEGAAQGNRWEASNGKHQGRSQAGPRPAGADAGMAGAESIACTVSVIPGRASHPRRSCAGDRGAVTPRPSGAALDSHG